MKNKLFYCEDRFVFLLKLWNIKIVDWKEFSFDSKNWEIHSFEENEKYQMKYVNSLMFNIFCLYYCDKRNFSLDFQNKWNESVRSRR